MLDKKTVKNKFICHETKNELSFLLVFRFENRTIISTKLPYMIV